MLCCVFLIMKYYVVKYRKWPNSDLFVIHRLSLAEYHEQEEIFKLRIGHLKKVPLHKVRPFSPCSVSNTTNAEH